MSALCSAAGCGDCGRCTAAWEDDEEREETVRSLTDAEGCLLLALFCETASLDGDGDRATLTACVAARLLEWPWNRDRMGCVWPALTEAGLEALAAWLDPGTRAEFGLDA